MRFVVGGLVGGALVAASIVACSSATEASSSVPSGTDDTAAEGEGGSEKNTKEKDSGVALSADFFDSDVEDDDVFTHANPSSKTVDVAALRSLIKEAETQKSDSLVVALGDVIIAEKYFEKKSAPATIQSVTKSIVSLAIGMLIDEGKIASVDVPMSTFFPEWNTGKKAAVTLKHVLAMSSGMVDDSSGALFQQTDTLAYARARELTLPLGTFSYSNASATLLAGVGAIAAGEPLDTYVKRKLFQPLGITEWTWQKDASGNPGTSGGLFLTPREMLRIGRLVRDGGKWKDTRVVSSEWVSATTTTSLGYACYAYLWWLDREGCSASKGLSGEPGAIEGFYADGWGGNYISLSNASSIVGVRMKDVGVAPFEEVQTTAFEQFPRMIPQLVH